MFKIESNIPLPATLKTGQRVTYPFKAMAVGDSVLLPSASSSSKELTAARVYAHRTGKKFVWQPQEGGMRVWRLS